MGISRRQSKQRWAGHVPRVQDSKRIIGERQNGSLEQAREREEGKREDWRDDITAHMGTTTWNRVARERGKWTLYGEGFVQQVDE